MIEWQIRESSHGGYVAELLGKVEPGTLAEFVPGYIMGAVLYESVNFDTQKQAERYIKRRTKTK